MQKILNTMIAASLVLLLAACGGEAAKDKKGALGDLKVKLEKKKKEKSEIDAEITKLEAEIKKIDPSSAQSQKLVAVDTLGISDFSHFIELQGQVASDNLGFVSPPGSPGVVRAVYVKNGQKVSKGQTLLKLDDAIARQQLVAAQQSVSQLRARVAQLQTIYQRRQNLWKENIGTELDVINAKADVDATTSQLRAAEAQAASAQEQLNKTVVTAPISGTMVQVNIRVGEMFQGMLGQNTPQLAVVNNNNLKMTANVPENYISRVKVGDSVQVLVAETGKPYRSILSVVGAAVDPTNRSFIAEAKLPADPLLRPNQLATMKILDYKAKGAVTVPLNTVQSDEKGKYVYIIEKSGDKSLARKKAVIVGQSYGSVMEIKSGLTGNEVIITEGYQTVYDGQSVLISK